VCIREINLRINFTSTDKIILLVCKCGIFNFFLVIMASGSQRISARTRNFIPPAQADTVETKESCPTRANTGADTRRIVGFVVPDKPATMKFKFRGKFL